MTLLKRLAWAMVLAAGCSGGGGNGDGGDGANPTDATSCVPDAFTTCTCSNGAYGMATCTGAGTYAPCVCVLGIVPLGGVCDPAGQQNACVAQSSCEPNSASIDVCTADGAAYGACRTGSMPCNAGLGCGGYQQCVPAVPQGSSCDPTRTANVCATGSACSMDVCVTVIAAGGTCDPNLQHNLCAQGLSCVTGSSGSSTCIADGSNGGNCLPAYPACIAGLGCEHGTCVLGLTAGSPCDPLAMANVCASGSSCEATSDGGAQCIMDGASGGACRPGQQPCNPGLNCSAGICM